MEDTNIKIITCITEGIPVQDMIDIKSKNYDLNKVKILSALIYLNIAPLHGYPYNEFLFYYGKSLYLFCRS